MCRRVSLWALLAAIVSIPPALIADTAKRTRMTEKLFPFHEWSELALFLASDLFKKFGYPTLSLASHLAG